MAEILLIGAESRLSAGYLAACRLLKSGHIVTLLCRNRPADPKLLRDGIRRLVGPLNGSLARILTKADALLDARMPYLLSTTGQDVRQRIFDEMRGSDRLFVATSSNMVVYDSGSVPATERARVNRTADPLATDYERTILRERGIKSVVVRPAMVWGQFGMPPEGLKPWVTLSMRVRRGIYVEPGDNCLSAIHFADLAELYCSVLEHGLANPVLKLRVFHGSSEVFSFRQLAMTLNRCLRAKGDPRGLSMDEARKYSPFADALVKGIGLSSLLTQKTLGWSPKEASVLSRLEQDADKWAWRRRH